MMPENFVLIVKGAPIGIPVSWHPGAFNLFSIILGEHPFYETTHEAAARALYERLRRLPPMPWPELEQALSMLIDPWSSNYKRQGRMAISHAMDKVVTAIRDQEEQRRIKARQAEEQAEAKRFYQGNSSWGRF